MKIKITRHIPVEENVRPIMGEIYEVKSFQRINSHFRLFFVDVNGTDVGVYENTECEVVKE